MFENALLYVSLRSPFARRVRIAFRESNLPHQEKVLDVWKLQPELLVYNPLHRVPTLVLKNGSILVDSSLILESFYSSRNSSFFPENLEEGMLLRFWSSQAIGICDYVIAYFLEMQRSQQSRDPEVLTEAEGLILRVLEKFENHLSSNGSRLILGDQLTQADFDMGSALGYLDFRYSQAWRNQFPGAAQYWGVLESRDSFKSTQPLHCG